MFIQPIAAGYAFGILTPMTVRRSIEVVSYDPAWVRMFEREANNLQAVFGASLRSAEHIGSTAVPGLSAKPTIDILTVVAVDTDIPTFDGRMEVAGFVCRGEGLDALIPGTPGRFYYVRMDGVRHLTHVHVCAEGHFEIPQLLVLRDYLRTHPDRAADYGRVKSNLSQRFRYDNIGYIRGKDAFVKQLIEEAISWRANSR